MSAVTIQQMADRIATLLEERLGLAGSDLKAKASKAWRLPRRVRVAARELGDMAERSKNPKLLVQIDHERVAKCYDICQRDLVKRPARDGGRLGKFLGILATVVFGLLVLAAVVLVVKWMKGQI